MARRSLGTSTLTLPETKISKQLARYRKAPRKSQKNCKNCVHFNYTGNGVGTCDIVAGQVRAKWTSDFYSPDVGAFGRHDLEDLRP